MISEEVEVLMSARCVGESHEWDMKGLLEDMAFSGIEKEKTKERGVTIKRTI